MNFVIPSTKQQKRFYNEEKVEKLEEESDSSDIIEDESNTVFKIWKNKEEIVSSSKEIFNSINDDEILTIDPDTKTFKNKKFYIILDPSKNHRFPIKFTFPSSFTNSIFTVQCAQTVKISDKSLSKYCLIVRKINSNQVQVFEKKIIKIEKKSKTNPKTDPVLTRADAEVIMDSFKVPPKKTVLVKTVLPKTVNNNVSDKSIVSIDEYYKKAKEDALNNEILIRKARNDFFNNPENMKKIKDAAEQEAMREIHEQLNKSLMDQIRNNFK